MHQLWVSLSVASVKEVYHVFLELLAVFVNVLSGLNVCYATRWRKRTVNNTLSALGRSTSRATVVSRRNITAT